MTTAYAAMLETLAPRATRKIANNTCLTTVVDACLAHDTVDPDACAIRLHGHTIVYATPDGSVIIDQCGWPTLTTRDRINAVFTTYRDSIQGGPYRAQVERRTTYLMRLDATARDAQWARVGIIPASGAVTIGPRGGIRGLESPADTARVVKLRACIRDYSRGLAEALPLPLPDNGDCMFCSMFDGPATCGGLPEHLHTDHLLSHISKAERYYVPSLVWNALLYSGCTPNGIGLGYFWGAFEVPKLADRPDAREAATRLARTQVRTFVARYLSRALGVS